MAMPTRPAVTAAAPHVRDTMSVGRAMNWVVVALIPCLFMALFNTGYQANLAMAQLGVAAAPGWHGAVLDALATGYDPADGHLLEAWPGPPPGTFQYEMDKLRRQVRELAAEILDATGLERLVEWLEGGLRRLEKWLERKCR